MANEGLKRAVHQLTRDGNFIKEFDSVKAASEATKVGMGDISRCCRGKKKTAGGFRWVYCNSYLTLKKDPLDVLLNFEETDIELEDFFENYTY